MYQKQRKAVALISGGLDSMLAAKLIIEQGIQVEGLNFYTGFCHSGHTSAIRKQATNKQPKRNDALWVAEQLGIKLHIIDSVDEYKDVLINPRYGYGANLNPCVDCKVFMLRKAHVWADEHGFDFIITGEVIGQRPKSQRKETMQLIKKHSGSNDRLLRPLSAKLMEPTLPEREGWVERDKLKDFNGRSRKPQIALAEHYNFEQYAQPAGGCCVLTDVNYSNKLADMWKHRNKKDYGLDDIILLKVGRHIRPKPNFKLIIAREEGENNFLEGYSKQFDHIRIASHTGPLVLLEGELSREDIQLAARISARFSAGRHEEKIQIVFYQQQGVSHQLTVKPLQADEIPQEWYL